MKTILFILLSFLTTAVWAQTPPAPRSHSSAPANGERKEAAGYTFNFPGVDVSQVLDVYANLVGRTLLRATLPQANIVLKTQSALTKTEAIEALQGVLALNNIAVVNVGDKFVKVVPMQEAGAMGGAFSQKSASQLPDLGSFVTRIVQLKYVLPTKMAQVLQPFARMPNALFPIDDNGILVIRDYAENVKRMLEMIKKIDVNVPAEYISEVIPIKYAMADDIANALNNLGSGTSVSSIGNTTTPSRTTGTTGGMSQPGGNQLNNQYNNQNNSSFGSFNRSRTTGSTFQQRLQSIISHAGGGSGQGQIQIFGQAKIIADERSNSLLVFATPQDMETIKHIVEQLDVLLPQVLIEAVIMDYSLGPNTLNFGVSAAQNPQAYSSNPRTAGAGGMLNGSSPFLNLFSLLDNSSSLSNSVFGNNLGSGLSYFGNIGPNWDLALQAVAADSHANIIQRPRIQTSQAKEAQFFVGQTVPYITGTSYGTGYYGVGSSSYSQLSVGVELDVTPFINPNGLVVMDINQEIDDVNGYTTIDGNQVPNTDKRQLSSEVAVRNGDTIMLGGFIRTDKSNSRSGIPLLEDIPLLGYLFSSHASKKDRQELIVLLHPTVLDTPEIAAAQAVKEQQQLPGISAAAAEEAAEEQRQIKAERKAERKLREMEGNNNNNSDKFFTPVQPNAPATPSNPNENTNVYVIPNPPVQNP